MELVLVMGRLAKNGMIWNDPYLPWIEIPECRRYIHARINNNPIIMGRNVAEYLIERDLLLSERNIILSSRDMCYRGCTVAPSLEEAYRLAENRRAAFVLGGMTVLASVLVDRRLTRVYEAEVYDHDMEGEKMKGLERLSRERTSTDVEKYLRPVHWRMHVL